MKITKQRLKEIIKEELEDISVEDELGVTAPRHEGGTPEEKLIQSLLIRARVDKVGCPHSAAEMLGLGDDEEVVAYLADVMENPMFDNPGKTELREDRSIDLATAQKLAASAGVRWSGHLIILMKKYPNTPDGRRAFVAALKR